MIIICIHLTITVHNELLIEVLSLTTFLGIHKKWLDIKNGSAVLTDICIWNLISFSSLQKVSHLIMVCIAKLILLRGNTGIHGCVIVSIESTYLVDTLVILQFIGEVWTLGRVSNWKICSHLIVLVHPIVFVMLVCPVAIELIVNNVIWNNDMTV